MYLGLRSKVQHVLIQIILSYSGIQIVFRSTCKFVIYLVYSDPTNASGVKWPKYVVAKIGGIGEYNLEVKYL